MAAVAVAVVVVVVLVVVLSDDGERMGSFRADPGVLVETCGTGGTSGTIQLDRDVVVDLGVIFETDDGTPLHRAGREGIAVTAGVPEPWRVAYQELVVVEELRDETPNCVITLSSRE